MMGKLLNSTDTVMYCPAMKRIQLFTHSNSLNDSQRHHNESGGGGEPVFKSHILYESTYVMMSDETMKKTPEAGEHGGDGRLCPRA